MCHYQGKQIDTMHNFYNTKMPKKNQSMKLQKLSFFPIFRLSYQRASTYFLNNY